ncbi:MAG: 50S ribosomal protein L6 [Actinomycetota bacterium]
MSRIGKQPIVVPGGVDVSVADDGLVTVKGPRGELAQRLHPQITVVVDGEQVRVERPNDEGFFRGLHGLSRTLIANMIEGVTNGFEKRLEIIGVGYRAQMKGKDLEIAAGFSHPVAVRCPEGIVFETPTPTQIVIRGNDKQAVGEIAAKIRKVRKPEPYKGKGIRYEGEYVRKKAGKAAKATA